MSEENKAVVRSAYSAINAGDLDALAALIAEDLVEHDVVPGMPPTKAGVIQFFTGMRKSFSGLTLTVHDMITEGDKVFTRTTMSGTNVGEFMGMPAIRKHVEVPIARLLPPCERQSGRALGRHRYRHYERAARSVVDSRRWCTVPGLSAE